MTRLQRSSLALWALALCLVAAASPAAEWRPAPLYGGEVRSIAFSPASPEVVLAGTASGQVYRSRDGGATWSHAGSTFALAGWVVADLHFDVNRRDRLWAGLRGVWGGGAVAFSDDLGASWQFQVLWQERGVFALETVPGEEGRVVVGTDDGVWGSSDTGIGWRHLTAGEPDIVEVSSLLVDPRHSQTMVAGTFRRAYRSDDGGATWRGIFDGMVLDSQVFSMQTVPGRSGEWWASTCGWVYRTLDGGRRWQRFQTGLTERRTPSFQVLPGGRLLAGTVAGVYASDDGGETWALRTRSDLSILTLAHHPARPEVVLAGVEGSGVWRSDDGGTSFRPASHGITSPRIAALLASEGSLLAAVAHGGPASGLYATGDGARFLHLRAGLPTILTLASAGGQTWVGTEKGLFREASGLWELVQDLADARIGSVVPAGEGAIALTDRGLFHLRGTAVSPLAFAPGEVQSLAVRGDEVWVSSAGGLYRVRGEERRAVATPSGGAQVLAAGGRLLLAGVAGAWSRDGLDAAWVEHAAERSRLVSTGDAALPALLVRGAEAFLVREPEGSMLPLPLPFPGRDVMAAAVLGGRLYLGTAGYGLVSAPLADLAAPAGGAAATAVAASAP